MKKIAVVVGTRPNIIKVTRFRQVIAERGRHLMCLIHTGQHFSKNMADVFFDQLAIQPDRWLAVGGGSPITQIAAIMVGMETVIAEEKPDLVLVVGDVNSTVAAALAANKMNVLIGHLESGLRSFDRSMPEEHNRILTDCLADHFFITEESGLNNLRAEGAPEQSLHFVGNTMIDTLVAFDRQICESTVLTYLGLGSGGHALMTIHRPATADCPARLSETLELIAAIAKRRKVVFPIHPRTSKRLSDFRLKARADAIPGLILTEPLDYFAFQKLIATASYVLTDSGGIQEECTFRNVPCLTLRPNTERPVTVSLGSNELIPMDLNAILDTISRVESGIFKQGQIPPLWDGHATERIVEVLERVL